MRQTAIVAFLLALTWQSAWAQSPPFEIRRPYGPVANLPAETPAAESVNVWPPLGWSPTVFHGFARAVTAHKRLIVMFEEKSCTWCTRLEGAILSDPRFIQMQGRVVFAVADLSADDEKANNKKMFNDLKVERYPTLVLLDASVNNLQELTRLVGYHPADHILEVFESYMK
jgi:thioredoxin-related protein